ncbi:DUF2690 domain-containing protein [Streptomyces sp. NPDC046862]|uniref:DUF2690 domain-containing protein n=1 Tax=Streptomyces sp. NPDC046862 TaxID=3154603 RepID=UPI0034531A26
MMRGISVKSLLVVAAAMATTMIPLAGTSYAASCLGAGCDNKGPVTYTCDDDGVEARRVDASGRLARLIWSSKCDAAWVHIKNNANPTQYNSTAWIEKWNSSGTSLLKSLSVETPGYGKTDWSNMLGGASYMYRVCVSFEANIEPLRCSSKF